ncbi:DUF1206 domain-containing protein [Nocardia sp. SYP-A9097]|uniref:DUF1206 domain-containing protein n=1 Tax=Nocardia sp. SYP-A9097 TaxID=2663237 RepID=UPI001E4F7459|nr:DUF1206 domain-containing protein [Nocardia sp. SYP-A9097]
MTRSTQDLVVGLGRIGYIARGAVLAGIGIAALAASYAYDAANAKGVDGVLRDFAQTAFGPWLLILVALGLIAFGVFSFIEAKGVAPSAASRCSSRTPQSTTTTSRTAASIRWRPGGPEFRPRALADRTSVL